MADQPVVYYQLVLDTLPHVVLWSLSLGIATACNLCAIAAVITIACRLDQSFAYLTRRCTQIIGYAIVEIGYCVAYQEAIDLRPLRKLL